MKKNVTYVAFESFESIVADLGLATKENAGFVQVILGNGYHAYVARTKRVGRVDFQWTPSCEGIVELGEARFGRIVAQLDFGRSEAEILESFARALVEGMKMDAWVRPKQNARQLPSLPAQSAADRKAMLDRINAS